MERIFDIVIVGAGPAGIAAAISLMRNKKYPVKLALIDKARFPRDKVCGDAIPYWVFKELEEICPGIHQRMLETFDPQVFTSTRLYTSREKSISVDWSQPGYMIPRMQLDHFLLQQIPACGETQIIEGFPVKKILREGPLFHLLGETDGQSIQARYVVGADGAPSTVSRHLLKDFAHSYRSGSAVRTYMTGLTIPEPETALVFFDRQYAPGYFWFFPIGPDKANVGFGMTNAHRQRKHINLKDAFNYFVHTYPDLLGMSPDDIPRTDLKGGFLPFSSGVGRLTGKGFSLVGDAAYLTDPLSGDGIRNAVISGILVGKALGELKTPESLDYLNLITYQQRLKKRSHQELRYRSLAVSMIARLPFLVPWAASLGNQSWMIRKGKKWI